jgi:hypothetical protein
VERKNKKMQTFIPNSFAMLSAKGVFANSFKAKAVGEGCHSKKLNKLFANNRTHRLLPKNMNPKNP